MPTRLLLLAAVLSALFLTRCDSADASNEGCLEVTPNESYTLSGTAGTTSFAPGTKTYQVRNTCDEAIMLSVEEDVRWLDVDIAAFGGGGNEAGTLAANQQISVVVETRYGSDNAERLDQLSPGSYNADLRFDDDTNDDRITRPVNLTVN